MIISIFDTRKFDRAALEKEDLRFGHMDHIALQQKPS